MPAIHAYDRLTGAFPNEGTTHVVAVEALAEQADDVSAALTALARQTAADPRFTAAEPDVQVSADRWIRRKFLKRTALAEHLQSMRFSRRAVCVPSFRSAARLRSGGRGSAARRGSLAAGRARSRKLVDVELLARLAAALVNQAKPTCS